MSNVTLPATGSGSATPVVETSTNIDGSNRQVISVAGLTTVVVSTLTVSTASAYTAGQVVGGLFQVPNAVRNQNAINSGVLQNVVLVSRSSQAQIEMDLFLFASTLSAQSTFSDTKAPCLASGDVGKLLGRFPLVEVDAATIGSTTGGFYTTWQANSLTHAFNLSSGITSLYGSLVTKGTPSFLTASDLVLSVGIKND